MVQSSKSTISNSVDRICGNSSGRCRRCSAIACRAGGGQEAECRVSRPHCFPGAAWCCHALLPPAVPLQQLLCQPNPHTLPLAAAAGVGLCHLAGHTRHVPTKDNRHALTAAAGVGLSLPGWCLKKYPSRLSTAAAHCTTRVECKCTAAIKHGCFRCTCWVAHCCRTVHAHLGRQCKQQRCSN